MIIYNFIQIFINFLSLFNIVVIEKVEYLEDRVKIHFHYLNQSPIPDEYSECDILYDSIPKLPLDSGLPKTMEGEFDRDFWVEEVPVERLGKKIVYHFEEFQETAFSRMQMCVGGPYCMDYIVPIDPLNSIF